MNLFGILYQIVSIILFGDYNPGLIGDGHLIHEDWDGYLFAYRIAEYLGTLNPPIQ